MKTVLVLALLALAGPALAESMRAGDFIVRYNALSADGLPAASAKAQGVAHTPEQALLDVSASRIDNDENVEATVKADGRHPDRRKRRHRLPQDQRRRQYQLPGHLHGTKLRLTALLAGCHAQGRHDPARGIQPGFHRRLRPGLHIPTSFTRLACCRRMLRTCK